MRRKKWGIATLDRIDDVFGLDMEEMIERKRNTAELIKALHWKEKILFQKSKTN